MICPQSCFSLNTDRKHLAKENQVFTYSQHWWRRLRRHTRKEKILHSPKTPSELNHLTTPLDSSDENVSDYSSDIVTNKSGVGPLDYTTSTNHQPTTTKQHGSIQGIIRQQENGGGGQRA